MLSRALSAIVVGQLLLSIIASHISAASLQTLDSIDATTSPPQAVPSQLSNILIDGIPLNEIPADYMELLLIGLHGECQMSIMSTYCTNPSCSAALAAYEKWRQENGYGKSSIRW